MAGRPKDPSYSIELFAPDADYPAGADVWSGQPTKVIPPGQASVGFTPGQGIAAEHHNYLHAKRVAESQSAKDFMATMLAYVGQDPARNFRPSTTALGGTYRVKYLASTRKWLGYGYADTPAGQAIQTLDLQTWPTANGIGSPITVGDGCDVDPAGNIVIPGSSATDGASVMHWNGAAWATVTAVFPHKLDAPDCVYDPVNALWCIAGRRNSVNGSAEFYTSSNRTTWAASTGPASLPTQASKGVQVTLATDGAGKILAQCFDSASVSDHTTVSFSLSSDGGVTWSAISSFAHGLTPTGTGFFLPRPVWAGDRWVAFVSSALTTKIYTSTDGLSWSLASTLTTAGIYEIAALGVLIAATTKLGEVIMSIDGGVTWKWAGAQYIGNTYPPRISAAGERFFLLAPGLSTGPVNAKIWVGAGVGSGLSAVT